MTAKSIEAPGEVTVDDDVRQAARHGVARQAARCREGPHRAASTPARAAAKLKRQLLDALDERHKFELPPTLVEQEFENVWQTVENDLKQQGRTFADEGTTEDEAKAEYRKIAERRVRLGLVIAEIGDKNQIKVTDEEVQRAVVERARQFPGQEQQVWEFYRNNPQGAREPARADLRGKGRRLPGRARQGDREEGLARGALQGGRRRQAGREGRRLTAAR